MGKIRGTLRTRRHIFVLLPTTKSLDKSFVFKNDDAKEGLKKMTRLAWAQEVPSSNLGAPTINSRFFNPLLLPLSAPEPEFGSIWLQIQASRRFLLRDAVLPGPHANKSRA